MDFIRFSDKAKKYLDKLVRDSSFVFLDRKMVSDYLNNHKIPPFEKIIDFQVDFSGLKLKITSKPNSSFNSYLFSRVDILENRRIDFIEIEDKYYFDCGEYATAPFWFVIGSDGQICTYNNDDYTVNVIFDSFEKLIETFAFEDLLLKSGMYECPYFYNIENVNCINYFKENFSFRWIKINPSPCSANFAPRPLSPRSLRS